jgi:peptide/nickel transport system substrate-binding protein
MRALIPTVCLLLMVGIACTRPDSPDGHGDIAFRLRLNEDPPDMDPVRARDITSDAIMYKVFDGLVDLDPETLEIVPAVAESWEISSDATTYTFRLREGVRFHNSREVVADDVVYSFQRALREVRSGRPWVFTPIAGAKTFRDGTADHVSGLEAVDASTLRVTLDHAYAPFLSHLVTTQASILPREVYDDPDKAYLERPVGCGPFRFSSWTRGQSITLDPNADYYGEGPYLERVVFQIVRSSETALEEFRAGTLQMTDEIPPGKRQALREEFGDQFRRWPQLAVRSFLLNHARPPFQGNRALRQAVNHAVDREYILRVLDEGKDVAVAGLLPPGLQSFNPDLPGYGYDPERARELLAEAGYPGGSGLEELTLLYNTHEGHRRILERVVSDLGAVGIPVRLLNLEWGTFLSAITGTPEEPPTEEMIYFSWVADFPDGYNFLFPNLHSSNFGAGGNYARYSNPRVDAILDQAVRETDNARRITLYREAERLAVEDAAWLFFYSQRDEALVHSGVEGLVLSPLGDFASPLNRVRWAGAPGEG